jgi:hypothetical protein
MTMLKRPLKMVAILVGVSVLALGLLSVPTQAALNPIERFNDYLTTFDNPNNFANAVSQNCLRYTWHPDVVGDTQTVG